MSSLEVPKRAQDFFSRNRFTPVGLRQRFEKLSLCGCIKRERFVALATQDRDNGAVWKRLAIHNDLSRYDSAGCDHHVEILARLRHVVVILSAQRRRLPVSAHPTTRASRVERPVGVQVLRCSSSFRIVIRAASWFATAASLRIQRNAHHDAALAGRSVRHGPASRRALRVTQARAVVFRSVPPTSHGWKAPFPGRRKPLAPLLDRPRNDAPLTSDRPTREIGLSPTS